MTSRGFVRFTAGTFAALAVGGTAANAATIVNCIGEQSTITGEGVTGMADLWPAQLGVLLGAGYTVNNDGVNTGTVVAGTAKSAASLTGPPSIVIIGPFAEHDYAVGLTEAMWQADYKKLVDAYLALTPAPTVYVMTPPPAAFLYQSAAEQSFATDVVKPAVLAVAAGGNAAAKTLKVIDLFGDAALTTAAEMAGDGHLKPAGHKDVATLAYKCVAMGMCGAGTSTGTGGSSGSAGAGGTAGASGSNGTAGNGGAGVGGAGGGTAGAGGTSGVSGTTGASTGAAGASTGAAGTGAANTGTAGTTSSTGAAGITGTTGTGGSSSPTGAAGTGGSTTGTGGSPTGGAGAGSSQRSSSGGCTLADTGVAGTSGTLLLALLILSLSSRRRPSSS